MNYLKITDDPKIKTSKLMQMCRDKFSVFSYWDSKELDKEFPVPKKETTRYFKKQVEPDLLMKSYDDMVTEGIGFMTFRERLLAELDYFNETGEHLDIENSTITSSRTSFGKVADASWLPDSGRFCAGWCCAGYTDSLAGGRSAVSLSSLPDVLEINGIKYKKI